MAMKTRKSLSIASVLASALLAACSEPEPGGSAPIAELPPAHVSVAIAQLQTMPTFAEVSGETRAADTARISAKVMGAIEEMPVALGQSARQGELLVRIAAPEMSARVAQAEAQLNLVRRSLTRERALLGKNASTADATRNLADQAAAAEAGLQEARAMLAYAELRAPFDGRVARTFADVGSQAAPGAPLLDFEGDGAIEIAAGLPASLAASLEVGSRATVENPADGARFEVELTELSSSIDPQSRTIAARFAAIGDVSISTGQFVRILIPSGRSVRLLVPSEAVSSFGQMERVFVASEGRAEMRLVKTGAARDGGIEILSGLESGETIVVAGAARLREGQRLEVQP